MPAAVDVQFGPDLRGQLLAGLFAGLAEPPQFRVLLSRVFYCLPACASGQLRPLFADVLLHHEIRQGRLLPQAQHFVGGERRRLRSQLVPDGSLWSGGCLYGSLHHAAAVILEQRDIRLGPPVPHALILGRGPLQAVRGKCAGQGEESCEETSEKAGVQRRHRDAARAVPGSVACWRQRVTLRTRSASGAVPDELPVPDTSRGPLVTGDIEQPYWRGIRSRGLRHVTVMLARGSLS